MFDDKKELSPPAYSGAAGPSSAAQTSYASVSMHMGDRLRLLNFPPEMVATIRATISAYWPRGLQSEVPNYGGAYEFKLRGYPWYGHREDGVIARRLMARLLGALQQSGWMLTLVTDVSKKLTDLDTLVFRHAPTSMPQESDWMCVHFSMGDRLKLIDAPEDLKRDIIGLAQRSKMLQTHRPYVGAGDAYEVKMLGYPWRASGSETMTARQFVLNLLGVLESSGWSVYASIDQKAQQGENSGDLDTWHCCRKKGWAPGWPVYRE